MSPVVVSLVKFSQRCGFLFLHSHNFIFISFLNPLMFSTAMTLLLKCDKSKLDAEPTSVLQTVVSEKCIHHSWITSLLLPILC